jgi:hypothetical protein
MADAAGSEYKVVQGKPGAVEKQLNELASKGWQVVGVASASSGLGSAFLYGFCALVTVVLRRDREQA